MKTFSTVTTILLILLAIYTALTTTWPSHLPRRPLAEDSFSTERALKHVEAVSQQPHAVGFPAHRQVREYLLSQLRELGLEPVLQEGYTAGDWANFSKATNIMARIKGSGNGRALLLLSHYDSSPHSSLGASDDGSGMATVLEGVRAFLASHPSPKNDIIILFTDAEELGLNGADLFVNRHAWAADVGLVLNFEARGSGGPSYMLLETNGGNRNLIKEFMAADPHYPVGNSLVYSIYKMLPNDTDLTVFREDADIDGFNFAFIDDHFDYHTRLDNYSRLDRTSLEHQGSYLMPLLQHFSMADLGQLKSDSDEVYFDVPFFRLLAYPYAWIWPMFALAAACFLALIFFGLRKNILQWKDMAKGLGSSLLVLLINGSLGYFCWKGILKVYPAYMEILQGFPYNGHFYIAAFVFLSLAVCFWTYQPFRKEQLPNLLVAPLLLWLALCGALAAYLPGASFFIIPVFGFLAAFLIVLYQKEPEPLVLVALSVPALWILAPLVQMFPVGLGLKMLVTSTLLTTLLFFLLLPVFGKMRARWQLGGLCFLIFLGFMTGAHLTSGFNTDRPRPTSLVYLMDEDSGEARWLSYDSRLSAWNASFFKDGESPASSGDKTSLSSKYGSAFTHSAAAPVKEIDPPLVTTNRDTVISDTRVLSIEIHSQRKVNRLEIFTGNTPVTKAIVNGIPLSPEFLEARRGPRLLTHYISGEDATSLEISIPKDNSLDLTLYEASNDLLKHPLFTVPERPKDEIPKPFVLNDAILVKKTVRFE